MKLMNGKDSDHHDLHRKSGTGLANTKKRLELLYKDKYELLITDEPEVFVVNLKLQLLAAKQPAPAETPQPKLNYA